MEETPITRVNSGKTATVLMGSWSSKCSACDGNCDPDESHHIHGGPGGRHAEGSSLGDANGCGAKFGRVIDEYADEYGE